MAVKTTEELILLVKAQTEEAKKSLENLEASMEQLQDQIDEVVESNDDLTDSTDKATDANKKESASVEDLIGKYAARVISITAVVAAMAKMVKAGEENNIAHAKTQAVLQALGDQTNITYTQLDRLSTRVSKTTGQSTEDIQSAAAEILVSLNAPSDKLEEYINAAADLSALWGTDLKSSAKTLAEILAEPDKAMEKLRSQGIFLDESSKQLITDMLSMNDVAGAQGVIMEQLSGKIGSVAESVKDAKNFGSLRQAWDEVIAYMGEQWANAPFVKGLADGLMEGLDRSKSMDSALEFVKTFTSDANKALNSLSSDDADFLSSFLGDISEYSLQDQRKLFGALGVKNSTQYAQAIQPVIEALDNQKEALLENEEAQRIENALLAEQKRAAEEAANKTLALSAAYKSTGEGQLEDLRSQISALEKQRDEDLILQNTEGDVGAQAKERLGMYDAIIEGLKARLAEAETVKTSFEQILGTNDVQGFVSDVPIAFKLDRSQLDEEKEKLNVLKTAYERLYDPDNGSQEYVENMKVLLDAYNDQLAVVNSIEAAEAQRKEQEKDIAKAQEYSLSLLTEEEKRRASITSQIEELERLNEEGLITDEQKTEILLATVQSEEDLQYLYDQHVISLEQMKDKQEEMKSITAIVKSSWEELKSKVFDVNKIASTSTAIFQKMGENMAAGEEAGEGLDEALGDFASQLSSQLATTAIAAGLRVIAESGYAGIPVALALFALGGVAGISSGLMSGKGSGLDSTMLDSIKEEVAAREKLADTISQSIDEEYYLLKRQLERNLISVEQFRGESSGLQSQKNLNDATVETFRVAQARITDLNSKLESMSGWKKFWSSKDEGYESDANSIAAILNSISDNPDEEELRKVITKLAKYGVDTSSIPAFADGGSFITNGPQLIMVGDNPSGQEVVNIQPIGNNASYGGNITINIQTAYGLEDLYEQLEVVKQKLERRRA